jgi:hypothetical protein
VLKDTEWSIETGQRMAVESAIDRFFVVASDWDRLPVATRVDRITHARIELAERIDELVETARRMQE